jgi:hypothetical protein
MTIRNIAMLSMLFVLGTAAQAVRGQQKTSPSPAGYDSAREVTLIGTVVSYQSAVDKPPLGAHLTLNTGAGTVDVHIPDARFLTANHLQIQAGDNLRIIGENVTVAGGTQFLARVIQKGMQALVIRSARGIPLSYAAPRTSSTTNSQGSAR